MSLEVSRAAIKRVLIEGAKLPRWDKLPPKEASLSEAVAVRYLHSLARNFSEVFPKSPMIYDLSAVRLVWIRLSTLLEVFPKLHSTKVGELIQAIRQPVASYYSSTQVEFACCTFVESEQLKLPDDVKSVFLKKFNRYVREFVSCVYPIDMASKDAARKFEAIYSAWSECFINPPKKAAEEEASVDGLLRFPKDYNYLLPDRRPSTGSEATVSPSPASSPASGSSSVGFSYTPPLQSVLTSGSSSAMFARSDSSSGNGSPAPTNFESGHRLASSSPNAGGD